MNKRAQILSWCLYDFANSSYSAVVAAVVFPVYFSREIASTSSEADLWWGLSMSISMAAVAITSPIMGGISDFSGKRKVLLIIYTLLAVLATSLLFLPQRGMVLLAFVLIVIAITVFRKIKNFNQQLLVVARVVGRLPDIPNRERNRSYSNRILRKDWKI